MSGYDIIAKTQANLCLILPSRVWNICFRHGLIKTGGPRELDYQLVREIIAQVTDFCTRIPTSDLDAGPDSPAKLFDMAMTAVELLKRSQSGDGNQSQGQKPRGKNTTEFQHGLIRVVYNSLGLLAAVS